MTKLILITFFTLNLTQAVGQISTFREFLTHQKGNLTHYAIYTSYGFNRGFADQLAFHHSETIFKDRDPLSFYGAESWRRKYTRGYPIQFTDGFHFHQWLGLSAQRVSLWSYSPPPKKSKWWVYVLDFTAHSASFSIGWYLSEAAIRR